MLFMWMPCTDAHAAELLIPGGQVIGIQIQSDVLTVAAYDDALCGHAQRAGLRIGDEILSINGRPVSCAEDLRASLQDSSTSVTLGIRRNEKSQTVKISPKHTDTGPRLGIYLKQGISGIGTVTWYDPATKAFGALGHGVNDAKGNPAAMIQGSAFSADVISVRRGVSGEPGQLKGSADPHDLCGALLRNTPQGIFGTASRGWPGEPLPVASFDEVKTGKATIRSTVSGNSVQEYSVEILKIYPDARQDGRNFLLKVTDPALLNTTGGIVQGMSGSPVLQDGKIIGAVTHVLVNSPDTGYGIFIENMLEAAS